MSKIRLGLIGCGGRGTGMLKNEMPRLTELAEVVAVADPNTVRLGLAKEAFGVDRAYVNYKDLLADDGVDAVMVSTPDWTHADIVIDAVKAGKHVYCEKVMATTLADANRMAEAGKGLGTVLYIGHNGRWAGTVQKVYELVQAGEIGRVKHVWAKRFVEGSKYWHRWHRESRYSGGLLLHKGSHRFDLLNWLAGASPKRVMGMAGLDVYTHQNPPPADRCLNCSQTESCLEYLDITKGSLKAMYLDAEHEDGYIRDQCVFGPQSDVYDNAVVTVEFANGVRGSYTEVHFAPIADSQSEIGLFGDLGLIVSRGGEVLLEKKPSKERSTFKIPKEQGGHGGSDFKVLRDFFVCIRDSKKPLSGVEEGWDSTIAGLAANLSIKEGAAVEIDRDARRLLVGGVADEMSA